MIEESPPVFAILGAAPHTTVRPATLGTAARMPPLALAGDGEAQAAMAAATAELEYT